MAAKNAGQAGQHYAPRYLEEKGYRVEARNFHSRYGEIDLIASNQSYLVFVEVKERKAGGLVSPLEAVTPQKKRRLIQTAVFYLGSHPTALQPRFDVVAILRAPDGSRQVTHIENAFEGGRGY